MSCSVLLPLLGHYACPKSNATVMRVFLLTTMLVALPALAHGAYVHFPDFYKFASTKTAKGLQQWKVRHHLFSV
jgi:hypothetical protein